MIIVRIIYLVARSTMVDPSRVEMAKSVLTVVTKVALEIEYHQILKKPKDWAKRRHPPNLLQ